MLTVGLIICWVCLVVAVGFDMAGFNMTKIILACWVLGMVLAIMKVAKEKKMRKEKRMKEKEQVCQPKPEFRGEVLDRMLAPGDFVREDGETDWDFVRRVAIDFFRQKRDFKLVATIIFGKSPTQWDDTEKWIFGDTDRRIMECPDNSHGRKQAEFLVKNFIRGFPPGPGDPATH